LVYVPRSLDVAECRLSLGTGGLGKQAILVLIKHGPKHIYFTGRNAKNAAQVVDEAKAIAPSVELTFIHCDQTSLASVVAAAQTFLSKSDRLDVLLCNAGVMAIPSGTTQDGYEIQFGTNHVAHALLVKELLPVIQQTAKETGDARIVSLTSLGFAITPSGGIVFQNLKSPQPLGIGGRWLRYGQSKLANIVYASELAKRYPDVTTVAVHPGIIWTELVTSLGWFDRMFIWLTTVGKLVEPHEGAYNSEWATTTDKKNLTSGTFYEPVGVLGKTTKDSLSPKLREELWNWTEKELERW